MLVDFLTDAVEDKEIEIKAMIYDCDMPDFIDSLGIKGAKLKAIIDDAPLHIKKINAIKGVENSGDPSCEDQVEKFLLSKGAAVVRGHFNRFQHNKVLIMFKNGKPTKVLTGSANFWSLEPKGAKSELVAHRGIRRFFRPH